MSAVNMTEGSTRRALLSFSLPVLAGQLFQLSYNLVDSAVAGNHIGSEALAAVGSAGFICNLSVAFAAGLFNGAGVLIGRCFGAKDGPGLRAALHMNMLLSAALGVLFTTAGLALTPLLLSLLATPPEVMPQAAAYLRIYFAGIAALMVYNAGAAVLTALGDTRKPLLYLIGSCVINIAGDYLFVLGFGWGVAGVAAATVLANTVSAVMVLAALARSEGYGKLSLRHIKIDPGLLARIAALGLPGGMQSALVTFSNLFVLGYVNGLGTAAMAGYTLASKIDQLAQMPMMVIGMAVGTFVSQNLGAGKVRRASKGVSTGLVIGISASVLLGAALLAAGRFVIGFFTPDPAVAEAAYKVMLMVAPFFFITGGTYVIPNALRSAGQTLFPSVVNIIGVVFMRQAYLFLITKWHYSITTVGLAVPVSWLCAAVPIIVYYLKRNWSCFEKTA